MKLFGGGAATRCPALDGRDWSAACLVASAAALALAAAATRRLAAHCATAPVGAAVAPGRDGEDQPAGFRAPGVPYVPCAAIVLNCLLMAQFDGLSHLYLVGFVALFLGGYATFQLFCGEAA